MSLATKYARLTCPVCGKGSSLRYIETCSEDESEVKTAWECDCSPIIVYIVEFKPTAQPNYNDAREKRRKFEKI